MKTKIELPVWVLGASVILHLLWTVGLILMLVVPGAAPSQFVTVVEVRVSATPEPVTATATVIRQTATPLPPTATRLPVATPVPCKGGGVAGVDCPIDVGGLAVRIVSLERTSVITVTTDTGEEIPYVPTAANDEFVIIHLVFPAGTMKSDLNVWFEDGGSHAPRLVDEAGKVYGYAVALVEEREGGFGLESVFVVAKGARGLILVIQGNAQVDLSLATDTTVAVEATTPAPTATS